MSCREREGHTTPIKKLWHLTFIDDGRRRDGGDVGEDDRGKLPKLK